jgi:organic radical activating enzyme
MSDIANTIMLTTKCSSGCRHCPFSDPNLEKLFLTRSAIQNIVNQLPDKLAVLSGGEPFEYPEISEILTDLSQQTTPFRIANRRKLIKKMFSNHLWLHPSENPKLQFKIENRRN